MTGQRPDHEAPTSRPRADAAQVDHAWQAFLRRFDLEHTFRFLEQQVGRTGRRSLTRPMHRNPPGPAPDDCPAP